MKTLIIALVLTLFATQAMAKGFRGSGFRSSSRPVSRPVTHNPYLTGVMVGGVLMASRPAHAVSTTSPTTK